MGSGTYGVVYKAIYSTATYSSVVAVKRCDEAIKEAEMMRKVLGCPYIIQLIARKDDYLIMEFMPQNLMQYLYKNHPLPGNAIRKIMWQLLSALDFMDSRNLSHRDLKPNNILINEEGNIKVCDFGFATDLDKLSGRHSTGMFNRMYRPPEMIVMIGAFKQGPEIDIWATGCILVELFTKEELFPFPKTQGDDRLTVIANRWGKPTSEDWIALMSSKKTDARHYYTGLLNEKFCDPFKRPMGYGATWGEALDLASKMLVWNPKRRISAAEALKHPFVAKFGA